MDKQGSTRMDQPAESRAVSIWTELTSRADHAVEHQDTLAAIRLYELALRGAGEIVDSSAIAAVHLRLGVLYGSRPGDSQHRAAKDHLTAARDRFRLASDGLGEGQALVELGHLAGSSGDVG